MTILYKIISNYTPIQANMHDTDKTKEQLINELNEMRRRISTIESLYDEYNHTRNKLHKSEDMCHRLIETANDAIFIADAETGIIININKRACSLLDMSEDEIRGMHLSELNPPEESERYKEIFRRCIQEGQIITDPLYVLNRSGERIPVEISINVLDFEGRKIIQGIFRDITERLKAEKILLASEKKYTMLFDNMLNGFSYHKVLFDEDNKPIDYVFLLVNDAFEIFTGLTKKDVIGNMVTEVIPGINNSETDLISIYGEVALTGKSTEFELYFEPFKKWYAVSAFSHEKGYFASVFDDITNQKKVESDLKVRIQELEEFYEMAVGREIKMKLTEF